MQHIKIPSMEYHLSIELPDGQFIHLQFTEAGTGGIDITFEEPKSVHLFKDDELTPIDSADDKVRQMLICPETHQFRED